MAQSSDFKVAGHSFRVSIADSGTADGSIITGLLPQLLPFRCHDAADNLLFGLTIDSGHQLTARGRQIGTYDTGASLTKIYITPDDCKEILIQTRKGVNAALLTIPAGKTDCRISLATGRACQLFGLDNALMTLYAYKSAARETLLMHASTVVSGGRAYPFIARSGTGKSTHSALWLKNIKGSELLNDDNPVLRVVDGRAVVYGSPWSGKTPCYCNSSCPVGGIARIVRSDCNHAERQMPTMAFASLLAAVATLKWDKTACQSVCDTVGKVVATTPIYNMYCRADDEAAMVCFKAIAQ